MNQEISEEFNCSANSMTVVCVGYLLKARQIGNRCRDMDWASFVSTPLASIIFG
jgi:hypothetical protein